ncbi:UNVERIFIED_CONTAM: hypothetical protein RMT77_005967 [Armadillidium vulgare]
MNKDLLVENDDLNNEEDGSSKKSSYDESWMKAAFDKAQEALSKGEVPVGCVIVYKDEIIASGRNTVNETKNATRHAEINALDALFEYCNIKHVAYEDLLKDCSLYVTVEPCIMCIEALGNLKLGKLIFGCSNDRFGGCGSVVNRHLEYRSMEIVKDIQKEKAIELLKQFYKGENPNAPTCKRKTN